jgi:plasmid stabilization system protein ParE
MNRTVRLREEADRDLAAAASWYEQQRVGLGHEFLDESLLSFRLIAEQPLRYPVVHRNTRRALMMHFPFTKFDELLYAFEFVSAGQPMEHEAYLCVTTGVIHYRSELGDDEEPLPDDIDDAEKYIAIPHRSDLGLGKRLVLDFAGEVLPDALADVEQIFRHKGAYARFKNLLEYRGMLQQWYDYEEKKKQDALRQWCHDRGIEIHG